MQDVAEGVAESRRRLGPIGYWGLHGAVRDAAAAHTLSARAALWRQPGPAGVPEAMILDLRGVSLDPSLRALWAGLILDGARAEPMRPAAWLLPPDLHDLGLGLTFAIAREGIMRRVMTGDAAPAAAYAWLSLRLALARGRSRTARQWPPA